MFPCFETILIKNSKPLHVKYHNDRCNKTRSELYNEKTPLDLAKYIKCDGDKRCKIIYDKEVLDVQYHPLKQRNFKNLKLKECDFTYKYKYLDRKNLDNSLESGYDDIVFTKDGYLLDTSIANIALFIDGKWLTPKDVLLCGTTRERLLGNGFLQIFPLHVNDIKRAKKFAMLNAIVGFCEFDLGKNAKNVTCKNKIYIN